MTVSRRLSSNTVLPVLVLLVVLVYGSLAVDGFATFANVRATLTLAAFVGIASLGLTFVVFLGGIDISVPFLISFANVLAAGLSQRHWPFLLVIVVVVGVCGLIGAVNGVLARALDIHPLIVTLATGTAVLGAVLWWTKGFPQGSAPDGLTRFDSTGADTGPIPLPPLVLLWVALAAVAVVVERRSIFGKRVFALGAAPRAAELALVRPVRVWTTTFGTTGVAAGSAGVLLLGFTGAASGTVGDPYLFRTIAAIVVGGTALTGGSGSYLRTCLGAVTLVALTTVLLGLNVPSTLVQVLIGFLILIMVAVSGRVPHVRSTI